MRHRLAAVVVVLAAALGVAGCTALRNDIQKIETAVSVVTTASVTPTEVYVAINTFDGVEATAKNYLRLHPCTATQSFPCRGPAQPVWDNLRKGRTARNNLKAYMRANLDRAVPSPDYSALTLATAALKDLIP